MLIGVSRASLNLLTLWSGEAAGPVGRFDGAQPEPIRRLSLGDWAKVAYRRIDHDRSQARRESRRSASCAAPRCLSIKRAFGVLTTRVALQLIHEPFDLTLGEPAEAMEAQAAHRGIQLFIDDQVAKFDFGLNRSNG